MEKKLDKEFLGKVIALAKGGVGGEKANAIRIVKRICAEHGLEFDDVMNESDVKEYYIDIVKKYKQVAIQIILRYGLLDYEDGIHDSYSGDRLYFKTTAEKFIETQNAYDVLIAKYKEERAALEEAFESAFLRKHDLYYKFKSREEHLEALKRQRERENKRTEAQKKKDEKAERMAQGLRFGLDDVDILKQLTGK